ncbi:MAG: sodium-dependent transporter [Planctomycetaceae bacterium]
MAQGTRTPEAWASRLGVIMAVAGSAVGLGNFLRFPGQAAQNGGGAFMVPYFITLLIVGIPLAWAEWTMGRYGGTRGFNSAPGILGAICRRPGARYIGVLGLLIPLVIYMYYVFIEAWCLCYAWNYIDGDLMLGSQPEKYTGFFDSYVGTAENGFLLGSTSLELLLMLVFVFGLNFFLIYRGVSKGIETFCKYAMPLMALCALCVLVRVLTLSPPASAPDQSVTEGLGFMWNPDFRALGDAKTWIAAAGQIFFSLSVGFGVIINYASYLSRKDDVALGSLTACTTNEFFEVCLGGLITLPAAFLFLGLATGDFAGSTFKLGFVALPNVFAQMPLGRMFGFLWFFMLFLAAITSSISMLQPVIAFLEEGFGLKRHASATLLGLITAMGTFFVVWFSKGLAALDTMDFWVGSVAIFVFALILVTIYGWVLGIDKGEAALHEGAHIRVPRFVQYNLKYVAPLYLLTIFAFFCVQNVPGYVKAIGESAEAQVTIGFIFIVAVFLLLLVHIAGKRWDKDGRFAAALAEQPPTTGEPK